MTSSSSLYGNVNQQNTQSTNSTSLYGGADTPIPTPEGDLVVRGDLIVLSGNILTTATTGNIFPANATTVNLGASATAVNIGADTGTTTINNNLVVDGSVTAEGADFGLITIGVADDQTITTTSGELRVGSATGIVKLPDVTTIYTDNTATFNLLNQPTVVNAFRAATTLNIGSDTGETNINNDLLVEGIGTFIGDITAPGADLGNITVGITDNNTITTTTGGIKIGAFDGNVGLIGVDTLYTDNTGTFNLLNSPTTIYAFDEATTLEIGASSGVGTTVVRNSFAVDGTQVGLAQGTIIAYSEANDRLNRPVVRSTTGNTSGFRVEAPNATTSASAVLSAFNTNDTDNGSFININARGNLTTPLRIQTGKYTSGVLGPSGTSLTFVDNITAYASLNPSGPTDPLDLTTKAYVDASAAAGVTSITGTADQVIASSSTGAVTLSLPQSIATTSNVTFADITATDDLTVQGNNVNLAPATLIGYNENNDRANRPVVRSTTGNSSGLRVEAPNATTSAIANVSAFSSNDGDNGKFINISARGAATTDLRIQTGKYTAGVLGASGTVVSFVDNITTYATVNPSGPTNPLDLTTKAYVDALPANITYTIDSSATTGGANLNLVGSDATTDTIKFAGGTNVTVVATDANTITINAPDTNTTYTQNFSSTTGGTNLNLVGSDSTTDTVKFADGTGVTVSYTDANTATVAIGQAVGTTDNVQFNGVTTNSLTTGTVNANGGVSFVNTAPLGGTYATINPFGPFNTDDLTTVGYVNSVLPTVVTYTQDASATTGGANLNLVGSDATTDTVKFSGSGATTVSQTSANEITISSTDTNTTYTQDVSSTTGGANLNLVGSDATTDSVKFAGGTNVTVVATDANTMTINAVDTNTTYTIDASSTTGGANLNLVGSDASTDTVKIAQGTGVSVTQTSANEISVAIGQSVGTGDSPSFAGISAGNISVGVATDNTITTTNTNGDLVLAANGTGAIVLSENTRLQGEMQASTNLNYVFPPQTLNTVTDNNGYSAASSFPAGTNGYGASMSYTHYYGDTLAGTATAPGFTFRNANGNSSTGDTIPFTGLTSVAPSAIGTGNVMGTQNFSGYATTGFANDLATQYQGGGINALQTMQVQSYAAENFSDSTLTLNSTNVTAIASSFRATMGTPTVVGTKGQIQYSGTSGAVGQAVRVTGTLTGTATGIVSGQTYYMIVYSNNGTNSFATLSATPGGSPITTTAGTLTGLTLIRCSISFTTTGLTNVPFGRGALVTVTGITNVTDGTYPVWGTPTTATFSLGVPHTVAPTVAGAQTFSCLTAYMGAAFRIRAFPLATPANLQNRLEIVDISPAAATFRSNSFTFNTGAYGNTGVGVTGNNINYNRVFGQFEYNTTITPAAINTAAVFPLGTAATNNIATVGSTSRLIAGAAGRYNLQFSVQVNNADTGQDHVAYIWLRKNGVDVVGSTGRVTVAKSVGTISGWNYLVTSANTTDYWEIAYAVEDLNITFPFYAATAFAPSTASVITTLTPVGA